MPYGPDAVADDIRRLLQDAESSKYEMPGALSLAFNHPGILAYQIKTAPHYQQDMRRAEVLDGVADMKARNDRYMRLTGDQSSHVFSEGLGRARIPFLEQALESRDTLKSPYWNRGVLAYGQPLRNGFDMMQAYASTNMNAGRMLGGDESAADDLSDSANRLLLGIPRAISGERDPLQFAWEMERKTEEGRPVADMSFAIDASERPRAFPGYSSLPFESFAQRGMTSGADITHPLLGNGLPGQLAAMAVDVATDPVSEGPAAIRALLRGQIVPGLGRLAGEAAIPGAFLGVNQALRTQAEEAERRLREGY